MVWVPSARVLCAIDVAFHDCNLWPIESNVERRVKWRESIAQAEGVRCPRRHPRPFRRVEAPAAGGGAGRHLPQLHRLHRLVARSTSDYYEDVYNTAKNGADFVEMMTKRYPLEAEDFAIHWQARLLFPRSSPDWLTPLPGEPDKIFLNPAGRVRRRSAEGVGAVAVLAVARERRALAAARECYFITGWVRYRAGLAFDRHPISCKESRWGMKIGFIGIGQMGIHMSRKIREAGYELVVHDVARYAAMPALQEGAAWADTPAAVAGACRGVIRLPTPRASRTLSWGEWYRLGWTAGDIYIDMSTNAPLTVRLIAESPRPWG